MHRIRMITAVYMYVFSWGLLPLGSMYGFAVTDNPD